MIRRIFILALYILSGTHMHAMSKVDDYGYLKSEGLEPKTDMEALNLKKADFNYFPKYPLFRLSPLRIPIIQNGIWLGDIFCRLEAEVTNEKDYETLAIIVYHLIDSVLSTFYANLGERFLIKTPLEAESWRPLIQEAMEKFIPIKNLYFRQFVLISHPSTPDTSMLRTSSKY